ncbi:unnamed protein product [Somion occarium]|uniref:Protein kinase domain-containing protein n=1 Tax=Somion occarium TaxID=3059160 RepID=A0ABP1CES4_9APHY
MCEPNFAGVLRLTFQDGPGTTVFELTASNGSPNYAIAVQPLLRLDTDHADDHLLFGWSSKSQKRVILCSVTSFNRIPAAQHTEQPTHVATKWARGFAGIRNLQHELDIYQDHLRDLQGVCVPRCFGLYTGKAEGNDVGCLVLEWCAGKKPVDEHEVIRQVMTAITAIHKVGIIHNDLPNPQHVAAGNNNKIHILDFSKANTHECPGALPKTFNGDHLDGLPPPGCPELDAMEDAFTSDLPEYTLRVISRNRGWPRTEEDDQHRTNGHQRIKDSQPIPNEVQPTPWGVCYTQ